MVNGFRYYRALESVSIASALSTALTIYPCQIRVHQRWQSKLPTSYSSEEGVAAGHSGQFTPGGYLSTVKHTVVARIEPTTFRLVVRRATSSATETIRNIEAIGKLSEKPTTINVGHLLLLHIVDNTTTRCTARWQLRYASLPDNYRLYTHTIPYLCLNLLS